MKIRTGFVSNSSSSSFCLLGVQLGTRSLEKVTKKDLKTFQEICCFTGLDSEEGRVLLHIDQEDFLEFVKKHEQDLKIEAVYGVVTTSEVDPKKLPKNRGKLVVESTIEEQSSPRCLADLMVELEYCAPHLLNDADIKEE